MLLEAYDAYGFKDMSYKEPSVKITAIIKIIKEIKKKDPSAQIIIFSAYRSFQDILYYHLAQIKGIGAEKQARYHGKMSKNKKSLELNRFIIGEADILLTIFKSGGLGLNLTCATHVIFAEPSFTYADWTQAVGRIYRY